MFTWALKKLLGTSHEREVKKLRPRVAAITEPEPNI
jgi:preprotein translocase subunit SecA